MKSTTNFGKENRTYISLLCDAWMKHRTKLLFSAIALMSIAAIARLDTEFYRLIWMKTSLGAIDLRFRHGEVNTWFAGNPTYGVLVHSMYPPASYAMLWPFLGWLSFKLARVLWALTSVLMLGWIAYLTIRESLANTTLERFFLLLLPLSAYPTGAAIGNGQLVLLVIPMVVTGLILMCRNSKLTGDSLAAALVLMALVSPAIAVPFFWIALFVPGRLRPAILVVLGYVVLTLFASSFQDSSSVSLIRDWFATAQMGAWSGARQGGYSNLHSWLALFGVTAGNRYFSLIALLALGAWIYRYRKADLWLLIGVSAIVARIWTYHRRYDDLLILLPMIALFRMAKSEASEDRSRVLAAILFATAWCIMVAPIYFIFSSPPWSWLMRGAQVITWGLILVFLLYRVQREKTVSSEEGSRLNPANI